MDFSASSSRATFAVAFALNSASRSDDAAFRAAKKTSWAALNRCHSASSASRGARPDAFHSARSSRKAPAVGPQSVSYTHLTLPTIYSV